MKWKVRGNVTLCTLWLIGMKVKHSFQDLLEGGDLTSIMKNV